MLRLLFLCIKFGRIYIITLRTRDKEPENKDDSLRNKHDNVMRLCVCGFGRYWRFATLLYIR